MAIGQSRYSSCQWPGSESESAGPTQVPMVSPALRSELAKASPVARLRVRVRRDHQTIRPGESESAGETISSTIGQSPGRTIGDGRPARLLASSRTIGRDYRETIGQSPGRTIQVPVGESSGRPRLLARLLAPSPGRICNDSRSRGLRLDYKIRLMEIPYPSSHY